MNKVMQFISSISYFKKLYSSILLLIVCDIFNIFWIKNQALNENGIKQLALQALLVKGINPQEVDSLMITELSDLASKMISLGFLIFMIVNLIFYFLMYRRKNTGIKYVKGYAISGAALTVITTLQYIQGPIAWTMGQVIVTLAYFYCFFAIKDTFKNEQL